MEYILLHFDYIGVGTAVYLDSLTLTYMFFYSETIHRDNILAAMLVLYFCNMLVQLFPCYAAEQFMLHKNVLFLTCGISTCMIAAVWAACYADQEEFRLFSFRLLLVYLQVTPGFILFITHYPERAFPNSRFVHIFLQSHMWWHISVHVSGWTLYWLMYDF